MKRHIAIYHTWPETKNAEYENIMRIIGAAQNIGLDVTVVDNQSVPLFSTRADIDLYAAAIPPASIDFCISLHFESPKLHDFYTYHALWNPIDFYFVWGYDKTVRQILTHDDVLSCDSDFVDAHTFNLFESFSRRLIQPVPRMHHSLSNNVIEPKVNENLKAFYIGINWEKISQSHGRHHELLLALDGAGMVDIYGPESFHGVKPWEGFTCYRGSIPFDGRSTVERIAEAGICLAFSSTAHQKSGVMSNRLFEGLAAGALVIANKHPFLDKFFGELIPTVDDTKSAGEVIFEIKRIIRAARENPEATRDRAKAAQNIFLEKFVLESSLSKLMAEHNDRVAHSIALTAPQTTVGVVVSFTSTRFSEFEAIISGIAHQVHKPSRLAIACDETWYGLQRHRIESLLADSGFDAKFFTTELFEYESNLDRHGARKLGIGSVISRAIRSLETDAFLILKPSEIIFSDHIRRLVNTLSQEETAFAACSGVLLEARDHMGLPRRRFEYLEPDHDNHFLFCDEIRYSGSKLFKSSLVEYSSLSVLELLDGEEHNYFAGLAYRLGEIRMSRAATYVLNEPDFDRRRSTVTPELQQHQFIRDAVAGFNRHAASEPKKAPNLRVHFTNVGSESIYWGHVRRPMDVGLALTPGFTYVTNSECSCRSIFSAGSGWSQFEPDGIWIEGRVGVIEFRIGADKDALLKAKKVRFQLSLQGRPDMKDGRDEHVTLIANGVNIAYLHTPSAWTLFTVDAPKEHILADSDQVRLRLVLDHAEQVCDDEGAVLDSRYLGLRIASLSIMLD